MEPAILDTTVRLIGEAYAFFDSLQMSVTALAVALVIVVFGFVFAMRQAVTWFFKIDDLKSDVLRLQNLVLQMEGEVRVLQTLFTNDAPETLGKEKTIAAVPSATEVAALNEVSKAARAFPISH